MLPLDICTFFGVEGWIDDVIIGTKTTKTLKSGVAINIFDNQKVSDMLFTH